MNVNNIEELQLLSFKNLEKLIINTKLSEEFLEELLKNNHSPNLLDLILEYQSFSETFLRNVLIPLNISFLHLGFNNNIQLSNAFIDDFSHEIGNTIRPFLFHTKFSEKFLQDFIIPPDYDCILLELFEDLNAVILTTQTLSPYFLEKMNEVVHFDKCEYNIISEFQCLSEEFILNHLWNLDIKLICIHQPLTLKIIYEIYNSTDIHLLDFDIFIEFSEAQTQLFQNLTKNKYIPTQWFFDIESYKYLKPHWNSYYHHVSHLRRFQRIAKKRLLRKIQN